MPKEYGAGSSIHKYFQEWEAAGFFEKLWAMALEEYDKEKGIGWEWQSVDGCMVKAPLAHEAQDITRPSGKKWEQNGVY